MYSRVKQGSEARKDRPTAGRGGGGGGGGGALLVMACPEAGAKRQLQSISEVEPDLFQHAEAAA